MLGACCRYLDASLEEISRRLPHANPARCKERVENLIQTEKPDAIAAELLRFVARDAHSNRSARTQLSRDGNAVGKWPALPVHEGLEVFGSEASGLDEDGAVEILIQCQPAFLERFHNFIVTPRVVVMTDGEVSRRFAPIVPVPAIRRENSTDVEEHVSQRHSAHEHGSRRRAIEPRESERQTDELVFSGRRLAQIETLDDDDALLEKREVRPMMPGVKLLDRVIIDTDELHSAPCEIFGTVRGEIRVILHELRPPEEERVSRLQKDSRVRADLMPLEVRRTNGHDIIAECDENRGTDEPVEWNSVDRLPTVEEMLRRIDVCAGV